MALLYLNLFQLPAIYKHTLGEVCDTGRNGNGGNAASVKCVRVDAGYRLRELEAPVMPPGIQTSSVLSALYTMPFKLL